jgi:hypothetical protein
MLHRTGATGDDLAIGERTEPSVPLRYFSHPTASAWVKLESFVPARVRAALSPDIVDE